MILNKKGLVVLPLAALLFASCSPWKGVNYDKAKEFIETNYTIDGAKALYPTKVHEKFNATAADDESKIEAAALATFAYFYSPYKILEKLDWGTKAPYKCNYEDDYKASKDADYDPPIFPIVSEPTSGIVDYLMPSNEATGLTVTYQVNGKQFRQKKNAKSGALTIELIETYNDKGYRIERTGKCSCNGEMTDPLSGKKETLNFSFQFTGTYTY